MHLLQHPGPHQHPLMQPQLQVQLVHDRLLQVQVQWPRLLKANSVVVQMVWPHLDPQRQRAVGGQ